MEKIAYIGVDVHKDTNTAFMFYRDSQGNPSYYEIGTVASGTTPITRAIKKAMANCNLDPSFEVLAGYEAGPTGYGLCKSLQSQGYGCVIMAPTTTKKAPGERTKTDRRDARMLAMALATDAYKPVYVLDDEDQATREFTRARNALKGHMKKAKQQLLSFLLRLGRSYPDSGNNWTQKYMKWLESLEFNDPMLRYSFQTYLQEIKDFKVKIDMMDKMIEDLSKQDRYKGKVDKLMCFTGVEAHTALALVCEVGDFNRFPSAKEFSSYLGLCPGQVSTGKHIQYTGITKTGNSRVRTLLVEATKGIKRSNPYSKSWRISSRQQGQSPEIIAYADRGTKRIKKRMQNLESNRNKNANVATAAGARELACFVWGMMTGNIA